MKTMDTINNAIMKAHETFPALPNIETPDLVKHIMEFKAQLYDMEKQLETTNNILRAFEIELLHRPNDTRIHYFDRTNRYRIDDKPNA